MSVQILKTKLRIPPVRSNRVVRPRLFQRLDEGLFQGHSLFVIAAPAGFGKTTLVSDWASRLSGSVLTTSIDSLTTGFAPRVAWLALDESDNSPNRFWAYVMEALYEAQKINEPEADLAAQTRLGETAFTSLQSNTSVPVELVVGELINDLASHPQDFLLVLDDYHFIRSQEIHKGLAYLVDHQPGNLVLVIVTRSEPPLPLSRLRSRFRLTEINEDDLRFSHDEVRNFLQVTNGLDISSPSVAALEERTEGWAAGLQLAALALRQSGRTDIDPAVIRKFSGSHRYVLSYLTEEVLNLQPEPIRAFLIHTAFLDEMNAELCREVLGTAQSVEETQSILEYLDDNNLFVVPLDEEREWYRYHALFAGFLRSRMDDPGGARLRELRRKAGAWYANRRWWEKAISYSLAGEDFDSAASYMERVVRERIVLPLTWLEALPQQVLRARPLLCMAYASTLYLAGNRSVEELEGWLQASEKALAALPGAPPEYQALVRGLCLRTRASLAREAGNYDQAIALAQQALQILPPHDYAALSSAAIILEQSYSMRDDSQAMRNAAEMAWQYALASKSPSRIFVTGYNKMDLLLNFGRLTEAETVCREALRVAEEIGGVSALAVPESGAVYLGLAAICLHRFELDDAERYLQLGSKRIQMSGQRGIVAGAYLLSYHLYFARQDFTAAAQAIENLQAQIHKYSHDGHDLFTPYLLLGQVEDEPEHLQELLRWVEKVDLPPEFLLEGPAAPQWEEQVESKMHQEYELWLILITVLTALHRLGASAGKQVRLDTMLHILEVEQAFMQAQQWDNRVLELGIAKTMIYQAGGRVDQALNSLGEVLALAEPENNLLYMINQGRPMLGLLQSWLLWTGRDVHLEPFAQRLVGYFPLKWRAAPMPVAEPAPGVQAAGDQPGELLSERELEVLRLMALGRSNREIAADLVLALGTVKKHINNIFGKLGAANRTEAALAARNRGLIKD